MQRPIPTRFPSLRWPLLALFLAASLTVVGCDSEDSGMGDTPPEEPPLVTITIDNIRASAWEVTDVQGANLGDISDGTSENPALTLTVGTRYRFENNGGANHPLGFQDANSDYLLRQESGETGSLEDNADINYVEDDDGVTFTYTQALADDVATYICTFHSSMVGDIQTN